MDTSRPNASKMSTEIRFIFSWDTYLTSFNSHTIPSNILTKIVPIPSMRHGRSSHMTMEQLSSFSKLENQFLLGHTGINHQLKITWVTYGRSSDWEWKYRWVWVWSIYLWSTVWLGIDLLYKIYFSLWLLPLFLSLILGQSTFHYPNSLQKTHWFFFRSLNPDLDFNSRKCLCPSDWNTCLLPLMPLLMYYWKKITYSFSFIIYKNTRHIIIIKWLFLIN